MVTISSFNQPSTNRIFTGSRIVVSAVIYEWLNVLISSDMKFYYNYRQVSCTIEALHMLSILFAEMKASRGCTKALGQLYWLVWHTLYIPRSSTIV
jgi:hypothetical protein